MNETPNSYAYRCLPLSIANAHGWEVRCPVTCEAEWTGGSDTDDLRITFDEKESSALGPERVEKLVESHFGSGILTFDVGVVIRTSPGYDLWVTGPVNEFKDGIQPLSGVIETYWMPFAFTMNWKFTRPDLKVRFEKGEPFCHFFPIEHGLLERVDPVLERIGDDPELERQYRFALNRRAFLPALKKLKGDALEVEDKQRFQGWYMRGELPDGTDVADHRKRLQPKPFMPAGDKGTTQS